MLAIVNGKVLTITNGTIDEGVVLISNGKIKAVGKIGRASCRERVSVVV